MNTIRRVIAVQKRTALLGLVSAALAIMLAFSCLPGVSVTGASTLAQSPLDTPTLEPPPAPVDTPTDTPTPTPTPTEVPTEVLAPTDMPLPTEVPVDTPAPTEVPTEVPVDTPAPTEVPTDIPAPTEAPLPTDTPTEMPTEAPIPTDTPTETPIPTDTPTPTATPANEPTTSLIVRLVAGLSLDEQQQVIARNGGTETSSVPVLRMHFIDVPSSAVAEFIQRYQSDPQVSSVERDKVRQAEGTPTDPSYAEQWALPQIGWDAVFGSVTPGGSSVIAVLDTGIDASHPDLGGLVRSGFSAFEEADPLSDPNGHGTRVAGIAAARTDNGLGVAGVAYAGVSLLPVQVLGPDGTGQDSDIISGIVWATDQGADVVLMALSNPGYSPALQAAIDYAWGRGVVLVAAAGNDGSSTTTYPAGDRGVIGVSATDRDDTLAAGSNYGQSVFLAAPGVDVATTEQGGGYTSVTGTSAAAAQVAGAAAFMRAVDPSLSNAVIVGRLARNADPAGTADQTGNGRLNFARALEDTSTDPVKPAGAPPLGSGGPFVGPYVAAACTLTSVTVGVQSGTLTYGTSGSVTFTVTLAKSNGSCSGNWTAPTLPSGVTASFNPTGFSGSGSPKTTTLTLTSSTSTPAGSLSFTVRAAVDDAGPTKDGNGTLTINKATPTLSVTNSPVTYNGAAQAATVSGSVAGVISNVKYNGSGTVPTNAGTYAVTADFAPTDTTNYKSLTGASAGNFIINQATPTLSVTNSPVTYNGAAQAATVSGSVPGVVSNVKYNGSGTVPTNANTYAVTADFTPTDTTNYKSLTGASAGNFVIDKATPTLSVTNSPVTYNGAAQAATVSGSVPGVVSNVKYNGSGTVPTNAATYAVTADFTPTDTTNYKSLTGASAGNFVINKANAVIDVTPYDVTYDGNAHTATGTATGVKGESLSGLDLSGTTHTDAKAYPGDPWSFTDVTGNYNNASGTVDDNIEKADATIKVTAYDVTYDGDAHTATGSATGVKGESLSGLDLSGTTHTNAGSYKDDPWTFTDVTGNYNDASGTVDDNIEKAEAAIVVTPYDVTYDGNAHTATGTATGVKGESLSGLDLSGTTHTNAGFYEDDPWTFTDVTGNYNDASGVVDDSIDKANAVIVVTPYDVTYDATAHTATGTAKGVEDEDLAGLDLSGTTHTNAGLYEDDPWTFTDVTGNYNDASGVVDDNIKKAGSTTTVTVSDATYDGNPHGGTASVTGVGGLNQSVTVMYAGRNGTSYGPSATAPTNAGDYQARATFTGDANHTGSQDSKPFTINKASSTTTVTVSNATYDGTPHGGTASVTGVGGLNQSLTVSYSGRNGTIYGPSTTAPTNAGDYTASATFAGDANHTGSADSKDFSIAKAQTTLKITPPVNIQYSDPATLVATVSPASLNGYAATGSVEFFIGGTSVGSAPVNGSGVATLTGIQNLRAPGGYNVTAKFTSTNPNFTGSTGGPVTLIVTQENARSYYTGNSLFWGATTSATSAKVSLAATIKDITAVSGDPAYDAFGGDIRNAKVTFVNRDSSNAPLSGCSNLSVALVNSDTTVGTVTCDTTLSIGSSSGSQYNIGIVVNNYYTDNASGEDFVVTVAQPLTSNFITGGGYLVLSSSAGQYAGDPGSKTNYGFNVKYNKNGTNLQGNVNIIIRKGGRVYQIKSNSLQSLGVTPSPCAKATSTSPCKANFTSKANLTDITNPNNPIGLGGNMTLQMQMTDKGEPGASDTISFTLWNGSKLLFSSNWNGTKTVEQTLGGGNLVVH